MKSYADSWFRDDRAFWFSLAQCSSSKSSIISRLFNVICQLRMDNSQSAWTHAPQLVWDVSDHNSRSLIRLSVRRCIDLQRSLGHMLLNLLAANPGPPLLVSGLDRSFLLVASNGSWCQRWRRYQVVGQGRRRRRKSGVDEQAVKQARWINKRCSETVVISWKWQQGTGKRHYWGWIQLEWWSSGIQHLACMCTCIKKQGDERTYLYYCSCFAFKWWRSALLVYQYCGFSGNVAFIIALLKNFPAETERLYTERTAPPKTYTVSSSDLRSNANKHRQGKDKRDCLSLQNQSFFGWA